MSSPHSSRRFGAPLMHQLAKYGVVGIANTLIGFAIFVLCVKLGMQYLLASALAYAVGSLNGYVFNRRWTFDAGHVSHATSGTRYAAVQLSAIAANLVLLYLAVHVAAIEKIVAQAIVAALIFALTFVANRIWSFAHRGAQPLAPPAR